MKRLLLALVCTISLDAQSMHFGEPFALTNTRYPSDVAFQQVLRSDGRDAYQFWSTRFAIRMTVLDGRARAGVPTVATTQIGQFDAVWVGTHFVVAATSVRQPGMLGTQAFSARGQALGEPYVVAESAEHPRLAWNGTTLLLLYTTGGLVHSLPLGKEGRPIDGARETVADQVFGRPEATASGTGFITVTPRIGPTAHELQLTLFNASGRIVSTQQLKAQDFGWSAVASNGAETLAVWCGKSGLEAAIVRHDGSTQLVGPHPLALRDTASKPAVTWSGTEWVVGYTTQTEAYGVRTDALHVVRLDREGNWTTHEEREGWGDPAVLATTDGIRVAFYREASSNPALLLSMLPFAEHEPEVVTYVAATQQFAATAVSDDATLFLWQETGDESRTVFAGVRRANGEWWERRIGQNMHVYGAASDGSTFAVLVEPINVINSYAVMALDSRLRTLWTTPVDRRFTSLASNGEDYALAGARYDLTVAAVLLSSSGVLGAPVVVAPHDGSEQSPTETRIASDGHGFLVTWLMPGCAQFLCDDPVTVKGARLNSDLQRVDAEDLSLNEGQPYVVRSRLAWDGSDYIAVWPAGGSLYGAKVPPSGPADPSPFLVADVGDITLGSMTALGKGVAITWRQQSERTDHVAFLVEGRLAGRATFPWTFSDETPQITRTPDGRAMYVTTRLQTAPPHHAVTRLLAAVEDPLPVEVPDAPSLGVQAEGSTFVLRWKAPAQPVSGYRVEYRIGDGSWNELDRWFNADDLTTTFRASGKVAHTFRVRAWSDAGVTAYSAATSAASGKRRAMRR